MKTKKLILFFLSLMLSTVWAYELSAQSTSGNTQVVYGCTDGNALNYNKFATQDDGSCVYKRDTTGTTQLVYGCMDGNALNYNKLATKDDGSCVYKRDTTGTTQLVYGCMDGNALNYNKLATKDDGSCVYKRDTTGTTQLVYGCTDGNAMNYNKYANRDNGSCVYRVVSDTIKGCVDKLALNYNPLATVSVDVCIYQAREVWGCTSPKALNFNNNAKVDDGSCVYANPGNMFTAFVFSGSETVVDTLGYVIEDACNFDFTTAVDTVYISNITALEGNAIEAEWKLVQGTVISAFKSVYKIEKRGSTLLYLSLVCNQGRATDPSNQKKVKSTDTALVRGITLAAFISESASGVSQIAKDVDNLHLYPVPVQGSLQVKISNVNVENMQMSIIGVDGKTLLTKQFDELQSNNGINMDVSHLQKGIYFLMVKDENGIVGSRKFTKE